LDQRKSIFTGLGLVSFAHLIQAVVGSLFWILIASFLETESFGKISYDMSLPSILGAVGLLGLNTTLMIYLPKGKTEIKSQANILVLFASILVSIPLFSFNWTLPLLLVTSNFFYMTIAAMLGEKSYKEYSILIIGSRVLQLVLSLLFYSLIGNDGILLGYALSYLCFSHKFILSLKRKNFNISTLKPYFNFTANNLVIHITIMLYAWLDKVVIGILYGYSILGLYTIAYQFVGAASFVPSVLGTYLFPEEASGTNTTKIRHLGYVVSALMTPAGFFLLPILLENLFPNYIEAITPIKIMILSIFPATVVAILHSQFQGREDSRTVLIGTMIFLCVIMSSILFLGSMYGLTGIAIGLVLSHSIQGLFLWIQNYKYSHNTNIANMS